MVRDIVYQIWNSNTESVENGVSDAMELRERGLELTWCYNCNMPHESDLDERCLFLVA